MKALTLTAPGIFKLVEKDRPRIIEPTDAIVRVTLSSICSSDLHILHGSVPQAETGVTVGHEMTGIVEAVGEAVTSVRPGDRVAVNVETFCGRCFFCRNGWVNNCTDPQGGWALGCRIDGGQAEFVRVPHADNGLTRIPDNVSDEQALFVGDILATGYWAAKISEISEDDTVLVIGAGPTGLCTLACVLLRHPGHVIVCEQDQRRRAFVREHFPDVTVVAPGDCLSAAASLGRHGGADRVIEVAGTAESFAMAWQAARPNAIVTIVALYDEAQTLPLPEMYGKNLTFKTGGVDGCDCGEILRLIASGQLDTTPLITHRFPLSR
ncbi:MAG: alcohol dehydrogenase, partial [Muribaculaceae bacterium]|nr:alcohol dehydrogenase [Muribaculaceae bacterium]